MRNLVATVVTAAWAFSGVALADGQLVEFHIKAGTGQNSWNTQAEMLHVSVGDTVRIINDDDVVHTLHTDDDTPCPHGTDMDARGGSYDCVIATPFDPMGAGGPLHDHYYPVEKFWLEAK